MLFLESWRRRRAGLTGRLAILALEYLRLISVASSIRRFEHWVLWCLDEA